MLRCSAALGRTTEPAVVLYCFGAFGAGDIQSNGRIGLHWNLTELQNPGVGYKTSILDGPATYRRGQRADYSGGGWLVNPRAGSNAELNLLGDFFGPSIAREATELW
ncbi:uncharacterized protein LOC6035409 [Culex quinquefasciatus]|uniref:uncharacterized protein LOC6035409 n=1 Tax=Culex quinquefasciatus TaxID=7176 RepID=UPI00016D7B45|nr:uncharacterized protein LOC6035409 [Culex quinquefasciatus]